MRSLELPVLLHEVKNCLAAVKGNLALLRGQALPETAWAPMERLERVSSVLERLAMEGPKFAGGEEILDLAEVAEQCRADHFPEHAANIRIVKWNQGMVRGQAGMLGQVFVNLFRNSLEAGAVHIRLETRSTPSRVRVGLEDDGMGCPREVIPRLFEPGYSLKRSRGGTGMGLFLVKQVVESHGGSIRAIYREGKEGAGRGMRFLLDFPSDPGCGGLGRTAWARS